MRGAKPKTLSLSEGERKKGDLQPHLIRYWLTPPADPHREETLAAICGVSQQARTLLQQGE